MELIFGIVMFALAVGLAVIYGVMILLFIVEVWSRIFVTPEDWERLERWPPTPPEMPPWADRAD